MCIQHRKVGIGIVIVIAILVAVPVPGAAVPASDDVHVREQPDGTEFEAVQWGNEWYAGWETTDGYTIVQDNSSGWWYYAEEESGELVATDRRVGLESPEGLDKHLRGDRPDPPISYTDRDRGVMASASSHSSCFRDNIPTTGDVNMPVLLANFTDTSPTTSSNDFEQLLFGDDPAIATGPGSLKDYFDEASYGELNVDSGPEGVSGWYEADNAESVYGGGTGGSNATKSAPLVEETVKSADNDGFDFSAYDNDGDGCVSVVVIFQGDGESQSPDTDDIWPHRFSLAGASSTSPVKVDGVWVNSYSLQPETDYRTGNIKSIGTIAHETGHLFGLPDLYDTNDSNGPSAGIGEWGLMGSANFNQIGGVAGDSPAHPTALMKQRLDWGRTFLSPTGISKAGEEGLLPPITSSSLHYKIGSGDEYFLLTYRPQEGFDEGLPGEGMLIWHVDETQNNNDDETDKLIDLEAADGNQDLDNQNNRGDAGDPFPGSTAATRFADGTTPSANWKDGSASGVDLQNIEIDDSAAVFNNPPERTIEPNEEAAYAVAVSRSTPSGFTNSAGPIVARAAGDNGPVNITISSQKIVPVSSAELTSKFTQAGTRLSFTAPPLNVQPSGGYKVVYGPNRIVGQDITFRSTNTYTEYPLPSTADVVPIDASAGNFSSPNQITFELQVETGGADYTYGNFKSPDKSHFDITVDGQQIPPSAFTLTELREHKYQIRLTPPPQSAPGTSNLCLSFTDEKVGASHTAGPVCSAIQYTGESGQVSTSIIIDGSGSMSGTRIDTAKQAGRLFVDRLAGSDSAAVVSYDSSSSVEQPMTQVEGDRSKLKQAIESISAFGGTNIGGGMNAGLVQLSRGPAGTNKAGVLLSDGNENSGSISASEAAEDYSAQGIPVYTIALGSGADEQLMKEVADETEGNFYQAADSSNLQDIYSTISSDVAQAALIQLAKGKLDPGDSTTGDVSLDSSVDTANIEVSVGSSSSSPDSGPALSSHTQPTVRLRYPDGTLVGLNSSTASKTSDPDILYSVIGDTTIYQIEDPESGEWSYTINNTRSTTVSYTAKVDATTDATMSAGTDASQYTTGTDATLTATLLNDSGPVSGGTVTATITKPDGSSDQITLSENSPGTYTGTYTNLFNGTYEATVQAKIGSVEREQSLSWDVVDPDSVLNISVRDTPEVARGGDATLKLNLSRPAQSQTVTAGETTENRFQSRVQEYIQSAHSSSDERIADDPSPAQEVAQIILNQTQSERGALSVANNEIGLASHSSTVVYVNPTQLNGPQGTTIPSSRVTVDKSSLFLGSGENRSLTLTVEVPDDAPAGMYTGRVVGIVDGTVVSQQIEVNVTDTSASTYRSRIRQATANWEEVQTSSGKQYYERQIADHLTAYYFTSGSSSASTVTVGPAPEEDEAQAEGGA